MKAETQAKIKMHLNKIRGIHKILNRGLQNEAVHFAVISIEFFIEQIEAILEKENE